MRRRLTLGYYLLRYFGISWVLFRVAYALKLRLGWFRRVTPAGSWSDHPLASYLADPNITKEQLSRQRPPFFFDPADQAAFHPLLEQFDRSPAAGLSPQNIVAKLRQGKILYYGSRWQQVGYPPNWHRNPSTGQNTPADHHWSQISDFGQGDIKQIWEPSRFSFVFALVRAYWRSEDPALAGLFWELIEDWRHHNPPNQGANWKCGQETTFRVMAWCFGLYGFRESPHSTPERVANLMQMIAVSGHRIEKNIDYALSQHNNHGISEAAGLWTIGVLFPELKDAARWKKVGRHHLERQARMLFYDDGAFSQHSFNYQRVALHICLWVCRLAAVNQEPLSAELTERVRTGASFLQQFLAGSEGQLPNYGQNDGAYVLPLSSRPVTDYRPLLQALNLFFEGRRRFTEGPWDEEALWLLGADALTQQAAVNAKQQSLFVAKHGGYEVLRLPESVAFIRSGRFRHRPGQADLFHLDLWWRGRNIALDPGTYSYNDPPPWNNPLAESRFHNVVTLGDQSHMHRYGRFLWFPWTEGRVLKAAAAEDRVEWQGRLISEYGGRMVWDRQITGIAEGTWLVTDSIETDLNRPKKLRWLLPDMAYNWIAEGKLNIHLDEGEYKVVVFCSTPAKIELIRADEQTPCGWWAPLYHKKEPANSLIVSTDGVQPYFVTLLTPVASAWTLDVDGNLKKISENSPT